MRHASRNARQVSDIATKRNGNEPMKLSISRLPKDARRVHRKLSAPLLMLGLGLTIAAICSECWPAFAQSPNIRLVVPFTAGGGADGVARVVANGLSKQLGRTVI